ncbi:hypothetical protein Pst134EB_006141, partial [Puccinia striiformis f. sp. tritici]
EWRLNEVLGADKHGPGSQSDTAPAHPQTTTVQPQTASALLKRHRLTPCTVQVPPANGAPGQRSGNVMEHLIHLEIQSVQEAFNRQRQEHSDLNSQTHRKANAGKASIAGVNPTKRKLTLSLRKFQAGEAHTNQRSNDSRWGLEARPKDASSYDEHCSSSRRSSSTCGPTDTCKETIGASQWGPLRPLSWDASSGHASPIKCLPL